jgi:mRNA interferase RelE/StbE
MNVEFGPSFAKDLRDIRDKALRKRVGVAIETLEQAQDLGSVRGIVKLEGSDVHYRLRIGDYRMGIILEGDVIILARFLHRKDIYRCFP